MKHDKINFITCLMFFIFTLVFFFPGQVSYDSYIQNWEARNQMWDILHPPLMAFVWSKLLFFQYEQLSLLILQSLVYWTCVYLLSLQIQVKVFARFLPLFFFFPPLFGILGVIWKDVHMGLAFFLSFQMFLIIKKESKRFFWQLLFLVLVVLYGLAVRYNSLVVIFPFVVYFIVKIIKFKKESLTRVLLISGIVSSVLFLMAQTTNILLLKGRYNYLQKQYLHLYDISGISFYSHKNYFPEVISSRSSFNIDSIYSKYNNFDGNGITWNYLGLIAHDSQSIEKAWLTAIFTSPMAYVQHRLNLFSNLTSINIDPFYTFHYGVGKDFPRIQNQINDFLIRQKHASYYKFWYIFFAALFLAYLPIRKKTHFRDEILLLISSGTVYTLFYLPVGIASDYRYLWWSLLSFCISILLSINDHILIFQSRSKAD